MKKISISILCVLLFSSCSALFKRTVEFEGPAEAPTKQMQEVNKIVAIVNNRPIIESEVERKLSLLSSKKKISSSQRIVERNKIIDSLISEQLVAQLADEETIIVTEEKIDNTIEKMMQANGIKKIDDFIKLVEKREKIPYEIYREEIRKQILAELIMSIAINSGTPSRKEALAWYNKNKNSPQLLQVRVKHILIVPKGSSFSAEKKANSLADDIYKKINSGESFEKLAVKYSEDPGSASKGGDIGWTFLGTLDPYFANQAYQMNTPGSISPVFKSSFGYHIIKYMGRKSASFSEIENQIYGMLSGMGRKEQFKKWLDNQRANSKIIVYYKDYKPSK